MFYAHVSGKIQAVVDKSDIPGNHYDVEVDFVQKIFVDGKIVDRNWRIYAPKHKLKWLQKQAEKGFTVIMVLSDIYAMIHQKDMKPGQVHASGQLMELLTL